jgi:hypothetical protein
MTLPAILEVNDRLTALRSNLSIQQHLVIVYTATDNLVGANARQVAADTIQEEIKFLTKLKLLL